MNRLTALPSPIDMPVATLRHLTYPQWTELVQTLGHHEQAWHLATWRGARSVTMLGATLADATTRGGLRYRGRHNVYIGWKQDHTLPPGWAPRHSQSPYLVWHQFYPQLTLLRDWVNYRCKPTDTIRECLAILNERLIGTTHYQLCRTMERLIAMTTRMLAHTPDIAILAPNWSLDRISTELLRRKIHPNRLSPTTAKHIIQIHPGAHPMIVFPDAHIPAPLVEVVQNAYNIVLLAPEIHTTPDNHRTTVYLPNWDQIDTFALELATMWYRPDYLETRVASADPESVQLSTRRDLLATFQNQPVVAVRKSIMVHPDDVYSLPTFGSRRKIWPKKKPGSWNVRLRYVLMKQNSFGVTEPWGLTHTGWWVPLTPEERWDAVIK